MDLDTDKNLPISKDFQDELYKDVLKPSAQSLGEILSFLPRTIRLFLRGWEKWLINGEETLKVTAAAIKEKVSQIPADKIVEPEPYVVVPAIQQLCYCQDNEFIRDLYANLIVSSMNADKKWDVHPAFVDIIKQITPDEAKILGQLGNFKNNFQPLLDVKAFDNDNMEGGHQLIITNFTTVGFDVIEKKENICSYIDNLIRLNLIEIPPTYHLTDETLYIPLETSPVLKEMLARFSFFSSFYFSHKLFVISNLGLLFKKICCPSPYNASQNAKV